MQTSRIMFGSAVFLSLACAVPAYADEHQGGDTAVTRTHTVGNDKFRFTVKERQALQRYSVEDEKRRTAEGGDGKHHGDRHEKGYEKQKPLPPGLRKKAERGEALPPGWQKKLARGQVMPADIYAASHPLPEDVRRNLPPDPQGTVTVQVDGEIVRVVEDTRQIIDILRGKR